MKSLLKPLYLLYQLVVGLPLGLLATLLTALCTTIGSTLFSSRIWGYYPGMLWGRFMCALFLLPVRVSGKENLEKGKSYVITLNHQSIFDTFLVYGYIGINFKWLMKKELRKVPFVGTACNCAGHIMIDRSSKIKSQESLGIAKIRLVDGMSLVVFPEGTRTRTGAMGKLKRGAFQIAEDLQLEIVPVTINGCFHALPRGRFYLTHHTLSLTIHKPVAPKTTPLMDETQHTALMRQSTFEVEQAIKSALVM